MNNQKKVYIVVLGEPNSGKSFLVNRLTKTHGSIVSSKSHTTKQSIFSVAHLSNVEMIFIDTPGISSSKKKQIRTLKSEATSQINIGNVILALFDARFTPSSQMISILNKQNLPIIIGLTHMDRVNTIKSLPLTKFIHENLKKKDIEFFHLEPKSDYNFLLNKLQSYAYFDDWEFSKKHTSRSEYDQHIDRLREALFEHLYYEIPHEAKISLFMEEVKQKNCEKKKCTHKTHSHCIYSQVDVHVKKSQKPIILSKIADISKSMRHKLQDMLPKKLHLVLNIIS